MPIRGVFEEPFDGEFSVGKSRRSGGFCCDKITLRRAVQMCKGLEKIRYYKNEKGPVIGLWRLNVIEEDGLFFKDLDGSGELTAYKDWRLPPRERARALAEQLTAEEKAGLVFVNQKNCGLLQENKELTDESGLLDEEIVEAGASVFNVEKTYGTTYTLKHQKLRHLIFRQEPAPADMVRWINKLNEVAETERIFIPLQITSNSRNEVGKRVMAGDQTAEHFPTWPGTLGIAAAAKGAGLELFERFADCVRELWDACGLKKGYMYMADPLTDPRWQRSFGTFGEDVDFISEILERIIPRIQGSQEGVTPEGVALTLKHFPGGGARENGFDPHYRQGQWNVYPTEGSLRKYHLPPFRTAVRLKASSIMPYYAKPSNAKSALQKDKDGRALEFQEVGFAYNKYFIQDLLRGELGFEGYVNTDTGVSNKMAWGVEELDGPERVALALNNGVDLISGSVAVEDVLEALRRGREGWYGKERPVPEKYREEQLLLTEEVLDRAVQRTLTEIFASGLFENPYRDPQKAEAQAACETYREEAYRVHQQSVVLAKNKDNLLPLKAEKLSEMKIYLRCFEQKAEDAKKETAKLKEQLLARAETAGTALHFTEEPLEADVALMFVRPASGDYFSATPGFLEIDICEEKSVPTVDEDGRPTEQLHKETTLAELSWLHEAAEAVHAHGGKVVISIDINLPWMPGNAEPWADALLFGFQTKYEAVFDVLTGEAEAVGRLPLTLPRGDEVIAVDKEGRCISPNDVPGYDKDLYMPEELKDENGKAYAYRDSEGHYYELNYGLRYTE